MQSPTVMSLTSPPLRITIQVSLFRASDLAVGVACWALCSSRWKASGSLAARVSVSITVTRCRSSHR